MGISTTHPSQTDTTVSHRITKPTGSSSMSMYTPAISASIFTVYNVTRTVNRTIYQSITNKSHESALTTGYVHKRKSNSILSSSVSTYVYEVTTHRTTQPQPETTIPIKDITTTRMVPPGPRNDKITPHDHFTTTYNLSNRTGQHSSSSTTIVYANTTEHLKSTSGARATSVLYRKSTNHTLAESIGTCSQFAQG